MALLPVGVVLVGVVLAGVVVAWLVTNALRPHLYAGTVLQGNEQPSMGELTFVDGSPVDLAANEGSVIIVYFGYTNCPDVCPTTMLRASKAIEGLNSEQQAATQVWMVSVDPARDDLQTLDDYASFFSPTDEARFRGIGGPTEAVDLVTSRFGVYYSLEPKAAEGAEDYLVDHSSQLFGIDPDGSFRIIWSPTVTAEELRADIAALLD